MSVSDPRRKSRAMLEGPDRAGARAMLRAFGLGDEDFGKPQIGVGATWNKVTPCNAGLDVLRQAAAEHLNGAGVTAYEFDTIAVSDGISMGSDGMRASLVSRDWIADTVELVMRAHCYDGLLAIAGCDKSIPGMLLAMVRLDVPAVFAYGGSLAPGRVGDRDISLQDVYEAIGARSQNLISASELSAVEKAACPGVGTCAGMFSANTMASIAEAMGLTVPGMAAPPAAASDRLRVLHQAVDACDADIGNRVHFIAHHLRGDLRFLGHEQVAGAGAHYRDLAFAVQRPIAPDAHRAGSRKVLGVEVLALKSLGRLGRCSCHQHVAGTRLPRQARR